MKFQKFLTSGIFIAIVGIILFSAKAIMVKLVYQYHVTSLNLLIFRMLFSWPIYIACAFYYTPMSRKDIKQNDYLQIVFFGFVGYYLASYFDFLGLKYIKAGLERNILFIYPTLVLLISKIFLKKKMTNQQLIAVLITYFAVVIAFGVKCNFRESTLSWEVS